MSVNQDESIFSRDFVDASGQKDRDIQSLGQLKGDVQLSTTELSFVREITQLSETTGLTLGTQRTVPKH